MGSGEKSIECQQGSSRKWYVWLAGRFIANLQKRSKRERKRKNRKAIGCDEGKRNVEEIDQEAAMNETKDHKLHIQSKSRSKAKKITVKMTIKISAVKSKERK